MSYRIDVSGKAEKDMMRLPYADRVKVADRIERLAVDPRPQGSLKLKGQSEVLWRVRAGDYRILYAIDDGIRVIDIRRVGHRSDIYRG